MQKPEEPSQNLQNPPEQNSPDQLKVLEYAAVAASAVGSVAAAWFEQILFAATPLTLAAVLNVINRQRFEQQLRRYTTSAIADIQTVLEQSHPQPPQLQTDPQFLAESTTDSSVQNDLDPIVEAVTELQRVTQRLDEDVLRQQDWEILNVRFKLLEDTIEQFKPDVSSPVANPPEATSEGIKLSPVPQATPDLSPIQSQIDHLHHQVVRLDEQNRTIVKPYLSRLAQAVKKLQQHP
jgi:exonuclease VII large subunit